jgi:hypothetical protein
MFDFSYPNARPDARGWGSGYPNCQTDKWVPLFAKNGVRFGSVHFAVHDLLELILNECINRGYPPKMGQCWGSVCRCSHKSDGTCAKDSAGNPVPSNHSWGLAIDFNSLDNPFGGSTHKMPAWVPVLFREYGFRWLGPPIDDWQHFDFAGNPTDAKAMTEKARRELGDKMTDVEKAQLAKALEYGKEAHSALNAVEDFLEGTPPPLESTRIRKRTYKALVEAASRPAPGAHVHTATTTAK